MSGKIIFYDFAYPVKPEGWRISNNNDVIGGDDSLLIPSYLTFQTIDKDGFVFPYVKAFWISEKRCQVTILKNKRMGIQATCWVDGFGQVMCRADNEGELYIPEDWQNEEIILFDIEAAKSEIAYCKKRIKSYQAAGIYINDYIKNELDIAIEKLRQSDKLLNKEEKLLKANIALGHALNVSENIEVTRALQRLGKLSSKRSFSFSTFIDGNDVAPGRWDSGFSKKKGNKEFERNYLSICNTGAVSMFWKWSQPVNHDKFDWRIIDQQMNWIDSHGLDGIGHCLGWFHYMPEWIKHTREVEEMASYLINLTDETIKRYGHFIRLWSILNESHDWFYKEVNFSFEDRVFLFRAVKERISKIHPSAAVESDTCLVTQPSRMIKPEWENGPREWYKALEGSGINDYVIGIQLYHGAGSYATYDLGKLTQQIEFYCSLGHPVHIYAQSPGGIFDSCAWGVVNGCWHDPWSEYIQAEWWEKFLTIALSFNEVKGITAVSLEDCKHNWMPHGGFCREDLNPKKAYFSIKKVLEKYTNREIKVSWV